MDVETDRTTSTEVGGCSFCNRHVTERGYKEHAVTRVRFTTGQFRVCDECAPTIARDMAGAAVVIDTAGRLARALHEKGPGTKCGVYGCTEPGCQLP